MLRRVKGKNRTKIEKCVINSNKSAAFFHNLFANAKGAGISGTLRRRAVRGFGQRRREGGKLFHLLVRAAMPAFFIAPITGSQQQFATFLTIRAMKFIDRHRSMLPIMRRQVNSRHREALDLP